MCETVNLQHMEGEMAKLIYSMLTSLDIYTEDVHGDFGWGASEDEAVHAYINALAEPCSAQTRIERAFDPDIVRQLKADAERDMSIDGPELAAQAIHAGLVDEFQMIICPVIVGGGKRFFPAGARLDLARVEERRFGNGVVVLRYAVRS